MTTARPFVDFDTDGTLARWQPYQEVVVEKSAKSGKSFGKIYH